MQSDMETILAAPVPEGEQPKSDVDAVAAVLPKSSTFLENVGLRSTSSKKSSKSDVMAAHVTDLEEMLQRENEAMRAELAEMRRKAEESEAAQALRDKEHEELRRKTDETNERLAQFMSLMGAKVL